MPSRRLAASLRHEGQYQFTSAQRTARSFSAATKPQKQCFLLVSFIVLPSVLAAGNHGSEQQPKPAACEPNKPHSNHLKKYSATRSHVFFAIPHYYISLSLSTRTD
jgi:hypothetical protein